MSNFMHIKNDQKNQALAQTPPVPESELSFETARSSGPGGQRVNKVETKVRVVFDLWASQHFSFAQKSTIIRSADVQRHIRRDGKIAVSSQVHRSQMMNKNEAIAKLNELLAAALTREKERIATTPTTAVENERQRAKDLRSFKKMERRRSHSYDTE